MLRSRVLPSTLVALVSIPGILIGQKLHQGDALSAFTLVPLLIAIVFVAAALMHQAD